MLQAVPLNRNAGVRAVKLLGRAGVAAAAIAAAFTAHAEPGGTADAQGADQSEGLQDIVVTARRSRESIQDVPVSVTALDAAALNASFATNISDLKGVAPNVTLEMLPSFGRTTSYWIRGSGLNDGEASYEGPVGVVLDGVFINRTSGSVVDAFDLQNVEILRGPQGTLFGKNTTGGLVSITTKRPTGEWGLEAQLRMGSFGRRDAAIGLDIPISENVATRLSFRTFNSDGYARNLYDNRRLGGDKAYGVRSVTTFGNGDAFDGTLSLDYLHDKGEFVVVNVAEPGDGFFACDVLSYCYNGNPRQTYSNVKPSHRNQEVFHGAMTLNYDFGQHVLTSVTGYHGFWDNKSPIDFDGTPVGILELERHEKEYELSQEIRLESKRNGGPLHYLVGLYGFKQHYNFHSFTFLPVLTPDVGANQAIGDLTSFAAFASVDYEIFPQLTANIGVRATRETKKIAQSFSQKAATTAEQNDFYYNGNALPIDYRGKVSANNVAPKASLTWTPRSDLTIYGSYGRGFKSGGFSNRATDLVSAQPYGDEKVDAYELGFKSEWFGRTLRLNGAAFRNDFKGLQRLIGQPTYDVNGDVNGTTSSIVNAADAKIQGVELEMTWQPIEWLRLDGNFGYLDAKYTDFCGNFLRAGAGIADAHCVDRTRDVNALQNKDLKMPYAPKYSAGGGATVRHKFNDGSTITLNGKASYQSRQAIILSNEAFRKDTIQYDASIRWTGRDEIMTVSFFGKNLSDVTYPITSGNVGLTRFAVFNEPRTFGLQLDVKLGAR